MGLRLRARRPRPAAATVQADRAIVAGFLADAAHVPGGHADGVAFPRDEAEVAALVRAHGRVLAVGAQSSLTGGATPRGGIVLSTRALTGIAVRDDGSVHAGAGVPLADLQQALSSHARVYPPVPTYLGAFVGGTLATNAAGAATFKYGTTRAWVEALTVVLVDGSVLDLRRGEGTATAEFEIELPGGGVVNVPLPRYRPPAVPKCSAGYHAADALDPIDLFIGSEGTLGVIVSATLRTIARPRTTVLLRACASDAEAIAITAALCGEPDVDVAGIEYMDAASLARLDDDTFTRAGVPRPASGAVLLLAQIEGPLEAAAAVLEAHGGSEQVLAALPGDERAAARLLELREAVPAAINRLIGAAQREHPQVEKTAGDLIVPFARLGDSLTLYREAFDARGLEHATWGHFSDGNLHPNVVPRSFDEVRRGREALLEIGRAVVRMGGSPLAEHGVGRSAVKQALLRELYGEEGVAEMRAIKKALDPEGKLAPGVLLGEG